MMYVMYFCVTLSGGQRDCHPFHTAESFSTLAECQRYIQHDGLGQLHAWIAPKFRASTTLICQKG